VRWFAALGLIAALMAGQAAALDGPFAPNYLESSARVVRDLEHIAAKTGTPLLAEVRLSASGITIYAPRAPGTTDVDEWWPGWFAGENLGPALGHIPDSEAWFFGIDEVAWDAIPGLVAQVRETSAVASLEDISVRVFRPSEGEPVRIELYTSDEYGHSDRYEARIDGTGLVRLSVDGQRPPEAPNFLAEPAAVTAMLDIVAAEAGTAELFGVRWWDSRVFVDAPAAPGSLAVDEWSLDGIVGVRRSTGRDTADAAGDFFTADEVAWDAIPGLIDRAASAAGTANPDVAVSVERDESDRPGVITREHGGPVRIRLTVGDADRPSAPGLTFIAEADGSGLREG
jgi:hypothetical protein